MNQLNDFKANEINDTNTLKGGKRKDNFCEWYINQRGEKSEANNAEILMVRVDDVMIK